MYNVNALSTLSIISLPIYLVVGALAAKLADKFGKKEVSMIGLMIAGGIFLVAYFMHIKNAYTFIAIYAAATLGTCIFSMLSWAFITDIIDYNELKTGERNDATIYGVYSFTRKLGQAVAGAVTGYALTLIGYDSLAATQVESVKTGIYALSTLFPAACYILAGLLLMITYPLTKKVVQENVAKLRG